MVFSRPLPEKALRTSGRFAVGTAVCRSQQAYCWSRAANDSIYIYSKEAWALAPSYTV